MFGYPTGTSSKVPLPLVLRIGQIVGCLGFRVRSGDKSGRYQKPWHGGGTEMTQEMRSGGSIRFLASVGKMSALTLVGLFVIGFVWDQIDKHRHGPRIAPLAPIENYKPTAENEAKLRQFVLDVLNFTLLHETGHLVFHQYDVPVGSQDTNESAADSFAATIMLSEVRKSPNAQYNGLISAAAFWQALDILDKTENGSPQSGENAEADLDPHQGSGRRAVKLACLLFGTNPQAFADLAQQFHIEEQRDDCIRNAFQTRRAWTNVIALNLDPDAGKPLDLWAPHVAVRYNSIPHSLPDNVRALLTQERQIAQNLGILEIVGKNLLVLKTPPNPVVAIGRRMLNRREATERPGEVDMTPVVQAPQLDHPANDDVPFAFDYRVLGDSCLNAKNEPAQNAFWDPEKHSITLCYGWVGEIVYIGKRLLADAH